jgi:hypothetical protein
VIGCYDWGAWGDLRVTAELPDGRIIVGHLKDNDAEVLVPIPKRQGGSFIADAWKQRTPGADATDDSDDDHAAGNEHDGDGFSLYEEYRGFYVNRKHITLFPKNRDLFVYDKIKGQAARGFAIFERATGITVHSELQEDEMGSDRVMDFNRSDRTPVAYHQMQHGLVLELGRDPNASKVIPLSGRSPPLLPKDVLAVDISPSVSPFQGQMISFQRDGASIIKDESGGTIAHELSHACHIMHHGKTDLGNRVWQRDTSVTPHVIREFIPLDDWSVPSGQTGLIIHVFVEGTRNGREVPANNVLFDSPDLVYVASQKGQHSGNEACYMRYDNATAYTNPRRPRDGRVIVTDGEAYGTILCEDKKGTGINDASRLPWPRYGDATRGDCKSQVDCADGSTP